MEHQDLKHYLELIQALLDCPKGEEWNLLQQNETLISPELLEVMDEFAKQLASEGKTSAAQFLHQWEVQLAHLLQAAPPATKGHPQPRTEAYLNLIQTLLQCSKGAESKILAGHSELLDPGLVQIMQQVSAQLAAKGNQGVAIYLRHLAADISRMLQAQGAAPPTPAEVQAVQPAAHELIAPDPWEAAPEPPPVHAETHAEDSTMLPGIVQSLAHLNAILMNRLPPTKANPLWYMEPLERAFECEWVLSGEQVEYLIGSTPQCAPGQHTFHHNGWIFTKVLPTGAHLGWRVGKGSSEPVSISGNTKVNTKVESSKVATEKAMSSTSKHR
jgi:hypothetical protein